MHAVLITFHSAAGPEELTAPFTDHALALRGVPGLVAKAWLRDGATLGGFHLFTDRAAAERYLDSPLAAGLAAHPAFSRFEIRHFALLDELSRLTGTPQTGSPAAAPTR